MNQVSHLEPILCAPLLRKVDSHLIDSQGNCLRTSRIAPAWKVRDVAAVCSITHFSLVRDSCYVEAAEIRSPQDLAAFVNRLNREGVAV